MLGSGSSSTKSGKIRRIVKNGLQAWYKADKTQAPLGEEEIANGDFNEKGPDLIASKGGLTSAFTSGDFTHNSDGTMAINSDGVTNWSSGGVSVEGSKIYKVTVDIVSGTSGKFYIGGTSSSNFSGTGINIRYIKSSASTNLGYVGFNDCNGMVVRSCSVEKIDLNDSWVSDTATGGTVTIKDGSVDIVTDGATAGIQQVGVFTVGKKYKVIVDATITSGAGVQVGSDGDYDNIINVISSTSVVSATFVATHANFRIHREGSSAGNYTINSISIKEATNSVKDFSPNVNNGVLYSGKALHFAQTGDYIDIDYWKSKTIDANTKATFAVWFNCDDANPGAMIFAASGTNRFYLGAKGAKLELGWDSTGWQSYGEQTGAVPAIVNQTWYRAVVVVDGLTCSVYLNGELIYSKTTTNSSFTLDNNGVYIGSEGDVASNIWYGELADFQIYDKAWTASDVTYDWENPDKDVFDGSSNISPTDCTALYRLNEGAGNRLYNAAPVLGANLIGNSDFSGGVSGWFEGGSGTIEHVANFGGRSNVAKITTPTVYHNDNKVYHTFTAAVNAIYEVKLDVYVVSGEVRVDGANGDITGGAGASDIIQQGVTSGWVTVSRWAVGGSSADALTQLWIRAKSSTSDLECYIDNVSVREVTLPDSYVQESWVSGNWKTAQPYIPQYAMSSYSKKMIFDGDNDLVDCGEGTAIDNIFDGGGSWSAWFSAETDGESNAGTMLSKEKARIKTTADSGGDITMEFLHTFDTTAGVWAAPTDAVLLNKINHIVVTYDNSNVGNNPVIYINGVSVTVTETQTPVGTRESDASHELTIGAQNDAGTKAYDGFIDEVSVWDKELSAAEAQEIFNAGMALDCRDHSAVSNLEGYWRNSGTDQWDDLSTNSNNGTVSGSPTTIQLQEVPYFKKDTLGLPMNRVRERALNLDGGSYVTIDDSDDFNFGTTGFTIQAWVKPFSLAADDRIITKGTTDAAEWMISIDADNASVRVFAEDSGGAQVDTGSTFSALSVDTWAMITVVIDTPNDQVLFYKDDGSVETKSFSGWSGNFNGSAPLRIGANEALGADRFDGVIDDVKTYNRVLTQGEITKNYKATKSNHVSTSNWSDDFSDSFI